MKKDENFIPNDEPLLKVEQKLNKVEKKIDENTLAMEMLRELKKSSKRWFIAFIVVLVMLFATNIGWMIYEGQFEIVTETEETIVDSEDNGMATYLENSNAGDINYGKDN